MRIAAIHLPELRIEVVRAASAAAPAKVRDSEERSSPPTSEEGAREYEEELLEGPLAIVVAAPPLTEAKLLGNTRLDVVSREARALGVAPGQTIAQARARASELAVRVVRPDAVEGVLARLAEVALAFGATVSFATSSDAADSYGDVVWVDVTGCAHLHRSPVPSEGSAPGLESRASRGPAEERESPTDGEALLAVRLARVFAGLGHVCSVAIADGPRVAAILARSAAGFQSARASRVAARPRNRRQLEDDAEPALVVVPPGKNAVALAPLPVSALPLDVADARWLTKIGVRTIAELRALPRSALATRLGARAPLVLGLADGEDRAPLAPYVPPEVPEEEVTLEYGVEGAEALTFVAKTLADRLATRLACRAVAASRIELDLTLDVALLRAVAEGAAIVEGSEGERRGAAWATNTKKAEGERGRIQRLVVELPQPLSSASDLLAALRPKIERAVLLAPVLGAKLRAASLVHKPQAALSLLTPQPKAERALPRLVAELASDLGEEAVGRLALGDAWAPEERSRFVRLDRSALAKASGGTSKKPSSDVEGKRRRHMLSSVPEPTRILREPAMVSRDGMKVVRHLARIEAVDWWKPAPNAGVGAGSQFHGTAAWGAKGSDYVYAWVEDGAAWVEIDRASGAARIRGWFD